MNKETKKNLRRQDLFYILKNTLSFDKTIKDGDRFSAVSGYLDRIGDDDTGISIVVDSENNFSEVILTFDEAELLVDGLSDMIKRIKEER